MFIMISKPLILLEIVVLSLFKMKTLNSGKNKYLSHNIQLNDPRIFMDKLEHKCIWDDVGFIKVPRNFPSTQICSSCGEKNPGFSGLGNLGIRDWDCPHCGEHHERDVNASKNILKRGLQIVGTTVQ